MSVSLCTEEVKPIVDKLISTFPANLSEIDPDRIVFLRGNGKRRPVTLAAIKSPYDLFVKYKFILTIHGPKYDTLDDDRKAIALFDELIRIKEFETGTLKGHSVVGNFETLSTWGMDWLEAESVPSVFGEKKKDSKKAQ
jgi:hypothetical protein